MAIIQGTRRSANQGEAVFLEKAEEYLGHQVILYPHRQVYGQEIDAFLLLPGRGILVVEVKDWKEESILKTENDAVVLPGKEGQIREAPQKQARRYRFHLEQRIRNGTGLDPLVFEMVCLPRISREAFHRKNLHIVLEESFTFLEDDLASKQLFNGKLTGALRQVLQWPRSAFTDTAMLQVRSLFETPEELAASAAASAGTSASARVPQNTEYSIFSFLDSSVGPEDPRTADLARICVSGPRVYAIFARPDTLTKAANLVDQRLMSMGLVRNRDSLKPLWESGTSPVPPLSADMRSFQAFHCSFHALQSPCPGIPCFRITDGACTEEQAAWLETLAAASSFNLEQYQIEHAPADLNILVRAGAGTGKTWTMIARIAFLCHTGGLPAAKIAERIIMITFTNEAADQMRRRLKGYFSSLYLLTRRGDVLELVSSVESMQISTIDRYVLNLLRQLGSSLGYGQDITVTSSGTQRLEITRDLLNQWVRAQMISKGGSALDQLPILLYEVAKLIQEFIERLNNRKADFTTPGALDFGQASSDCCSPLLHDLLATLIPQVEKTHMEKLRESSRVELGTIMTCLQNILRQDGSEQRLIALNPDRNTMQFLFVDEFQDTDDVQIGCLLRLAEILNFRIFAVGDIKQCIYRFRGAEEKAFDSLHIEANPQKWKEFTLRRNYRTDLHLLAFFDRAFQAWGESTEKLLAYDHNDDGLISDIDCNGYLKKHPDRYPDSFLHRILIQDEEERMEKLADEITRLQNRIRYEEARGRAGSPAEQRIAILVRENWQADEVRKACAQRGISVQTDSGGTLYRTPAARDLLLLLNALAHPEDPKYLYPFAVSGYLSARITRYGLYSTRTEGMPSWAKASGAADTDQEIRKSLVDSINVALKDRNYPDTWDGILTALRLRPVLPVLEQLCAGLMPWRRETDPIEQQNYRTDLSQIFEELILSSTPDSLSVLQLQQKLAVFVATRTDTERRSTDEAMRDSPIRCITVHKAKGLEFGYVILPFCSSPLQADRTSRLQVTLKQDGTTGRVGYRMKLRDNLGILSNTNYKEEEETAEKKREEARILYVAMTRAIRSFSWITLEGKNALSWQTLIEAGGTPCTGS